jgi:hypothetical protein
MQQRQHRPARRQWPSPGRAARKRSRCHRSGPRCTVQAASPAISRANCAMCMRSRSGTSRPGRCTRRPRWDRARRPAPGWTAARRPRSRAAAHRPTGRRPCAGWTAGVRSSVPARRCAPAEADRLAARGAFRCVSRAVSSAVSLGRRRAGRRGDWRPLQAAMAMLTRGGGGGRRWASRQRRRRRRWRRVADQRPVAAFDSVRSSASTS